MNQAISQTEGPVSLTASAAKRIAQLAEKQGNPDLKLRISVDGGGCSGFQYKFEFAESAEDGDIIVTRDGATLLVDDMSLLYMAGAEVDFVQDIVGSAFKVKNPNAQANCGCGTSFSV